MGAPVATCSTIWAAHPTPRPSRNREKGASAGSLLARAKAARAKSTLGRAPVASRAALLSATVVSSMASPSRSAAARGSSSGVKRMAEAYSGR